MGRLPVLRHAGQLPDLARRDGPARSGGARSSPASSSSTSTRWRRSSSTTTCWSDRATTSTCRASCSRSIPRLATCSGSGIATPQKAGDPGLETWKNLDAAHPRRRPSVGAWRVRSRDPALHHGHGESDARLHLRAAWGRAGQSLHLRARRRPRRHRQDGVVLPDVAARHARLGLGADAGARRRRVQRPSAQDGGRPPRATAISSWSIALHGRAPADEQVLRHRRTGPGRS